MDANNAPGSAQAILAAVDVTPEEEKWLSELGKLAGLYQKRAETFVRFKSARPVRVGGKLIPVTDAMAEAQTFIETGVAIMLQEALVELAARNIDRDES